MKEAFIQYDQVTKRYGGFQAIHPLDLHIRQGEFLTLLGPSGSGKTTTLMMLAGFDAPTSGTITMAGRSLSGVPAYDRNIGMVFQNYALFPHMTVAENIAFPLSVRRVRPADATARVQDALALVRLQGLGDRRPAQLSGGQQQRVALARALVFRPPLVLMDEPLGALDRQLREQMQLEIKHIHARLGVTLVYVTHDQGEALTMSDRVAVFRDGRISQVAAPRALYEAPENSFVAGFIGESNQVAGTVVGQEGAHCIVEVAGGTRLRALAVGPFGPGGATTLSVRPERVRIGSGPADNLLLATVAEVIFHGDHVRARMSGAGCEGFQVTVPNAGAAADLRPGQAVQLGWQARDCRALDPLPA